MSMADDLNDPALNKLLSDCWAHNMRCLLSAPDEAALHFSGPKLRRTIEGRVLRWAQLRYDSGFAEVRIQSRRTWHYRRISTEDLAGLLGPRLAERLYVRFCQQHGSRCDAMRYLEHALLVGTQRPEPGTKIPCSPRYLLDARARINESLAAAGRPPLQQ